MTNLLTMLTSTPCLEIGSCSDCYARQANPVKHVGNLNQGKCTHPIQRHTEGSERAIATAEYMDLGVLREWQEDNSSHDTEPLGPMMGRRVWRVEGVKTPERFAPVRSAHGDRDTVSPYFHMIG